MNHVASQLFAGKKKGRSRRRKETLRFPCFIADGANRLPEEKKTHHFHLRCDMCQPPSWQRLSLRLMCFYGFPRKVACRSHFSRFSPEKVLTLVDSPQLDLFLMRMKVIFWGFIANMNSWRAVGEGRTTKQQQQQQQKVIFKFRSWFTIKRRREPKVCKWKWNFLRLKKQFEEKFLLSSPSEKRRKDGILFLNIPLSFPFFLFCSNIFIVGLVIRDDELLLSSPDGPSQSQAKPWALH